jgi:nitrogen fixation protein NifX
MKIAFTTKTGEVIDLHFGQAEEFQIWEVGPDEAGCSQTGSSADSSHEDHQGGRSPRDG